MNTHNPYEAFEQDQLTSRPQVHGGHGEYGGIGRAAYFLGSLGVGVLQQVLVFALFGGMAAMLQAPNPGGPPPGLGALPAGFFVVFGLGFIANLVLVGLRCTNLGMSPLWVLGMFVPCLNIYVAVVCLAGPAGYHQHKQLDTAGKIIMGIFLGFLALMLVAVLALQ